MVGDDLIDAYARRAASLVRPGPREVAWVYTAMHGVGARVVERVLAGPVP